MNNYYADPERELPCGCFENNFNSVMGNQLGKQCRCFFSSHSSSPSHSIIVCSFEAAIRFGSNQVVLLLVTTPHPPTERFSGTVDSSSSALLLWPPPPPLEDLYRVLGSLLFPELHLQSLHSATWWWRRPCSIRFE